MQKPLDPMSVDKTETPSVAYVLRRRYGPVRHVITILWLLRDTVIRRRAQVFHETANQSGVSGVRPTA